MDKEKLSTINYYWITKAILLAFMDVISIICSYFLALLLRFDFIFSKIPERYLTGYFWSMPFWIGATIVVFYIMRLYHSIWKMASIAEVRRIISAYLLLIVVYLAGILFMDLHMPRTYYFMGYVLSVCMTTGIRFSYRILRFYINGRLQEKDNVIDRVMIIGAGNTGRMLLRELFNRSDIHTKICCIIDDSPYKKGRLLEGIPIVGNRYEIASNVQKYGISRIIFAIPSASPQVKREILNICKETGCKLQSVPGLYELINDKTAIRRLRDVDVADLLGRESISVNLDEILGYVQGKVILVTGGGGSIGSEICRQLASHNVKRLIILDIYENNAYEIQQELKRKYPQLDLIVLIASVRNTNRMKNIMKTYQPNIVYHAAAHKHVPLMEESPNEAIKNNVFGTYKTASAAGRYQVERFVLISTDKAVNPTNIMGASKRICEMIIQTLDHYYKTEFVAVRFGNVLGSNGSVIPLFKKQIAEGGPVTVTHPDIIRYFMTIPEAVSLVLQAGAYAKGGEIFVLDMGEPVKIVDLAKNLIQLSGYEVEKDIKIEYTGLRPGEKLYEELLLKEEGLKETENELIHIGKPIEINEKLFMNQLAKLQAVVNEDSTDVRRLVKEIVSTYCYKEENRGSKSNF